VTDSTNNSKLIESVLLRGRTNRVDTAIFLLLLIVPIISCLLFGGVDAATWAVIVPVFGLLVLLWGIEAFKSGGLKIYRSPLPLALIGLIMIGVLQILPFYTISLDPFATRLLVVRLCVYLVFFAAAQTYFHTDLRINIATFTIVAFGVALSILGIVTFSGDGSTALGMRLTPQSIAFGPFINRHHFASFMLMTGGLALGLVFGRSLTNDKKALIAAGLAVMGIGIVFTASRGGILSFIVMLVFVSAMSFTTRPALSNNKTNNSRSSVMLWIALSVSLLLVMAGGAIILGGGESLLRYTGAGTADDISTGRTHFWAIAIKIFLDHPIIGAGLDAFGVAFTRYDSWDGTFRVEQAHNDYLQTLSDTGILGFACVAAFIFFLYKRSVSLTRTTQNEMRRSIAIGALTGCTGVLIHSFFDFPLRTPSNAFFFLLLAALATVHTNRAERR